MTLALEVAVVSFVLAGLVFAYVLARRVPRRQAVPAGSRADEVLPADATDVDRAHAHVRTSIEAVGPRHPDVATALDVLGDLLATQGRQLEAEDALGRALDIRTEIQGPDDAETLATAQRLANVERALGRTDRAIDRLERVVERQSITSGSTSPGTSAALADLGRAHAAAGDLETAARLLSDALGRAERTQGPGHLATARLLADRGAVAMALGDPDGGTTLERAAEICTRHAAFGRLGVMTIIGPVADGYLSAGRSREAQAVLRQALAIAERSLGEQHPDVGDALHRLGMLALADGDPRAAEAELERALVIRQSALQPGHADIAATIAGLGRSLLARGALDAAAPLLARATAELQQALGPEHADLLELHRGLATIHVAQGHDDDARPFLERARSMATRLGRDLEPGGVADSVALALLDVRNGRSEEAEADLRSVHDAIVAAGGEDAAELIVVRRALAIVRLARGDAADAHAIASRALALAEQLHGPTHPAVADTLRVLARCESAAGRHAAAENTLRRELLLRDPDDVGAADVLRALGAACVSQGKVAEAVDVLRRAADLHAALDTTATGEADVLEELGVAQRRLGDAAAAAASLERALARRLSGHSLEPAIARAAAALGAAQLESGRAADAESSLRRALAIRTAAPGPDHPETASIMADLGQALVELGRHAEAAGILERAIAVLDTGVATPELAQGVERLAGAHAGLARLDLAATALERAVFLREELGDGRLRVDDLVRLAEVQQARGRSSDAEWALRSALQALEHGEPDELMRASVLQRIATIYRTEWRLDEAEALLSDVLRTRERALSSDDMLIAETLNELERVYRSKGDLASARTVADRAGGLRRGRPENLSRATADR